MPKMCQHKVTKELWPYNGDLARHEDVEIVDVPDPQFAAVAAANPELTLGELQQAKVEPPPAPKKVKAKRVSKKAAAQPSAVGAEDSADDEDPLADLELTDDV